MAQVVVLNEGLDLGSHKLCTNTEKYRFRKTA